MRQTRGFTMVELLVALTIIGLIAALASGSIRLGLRGNERLLQQADTAETGRILEGQLRRWLETAEPVVVESRDRLPVPLLGSAEALEFSTEMAGRDGIGGLWRVRLTAAEGDALVMERRRILGEEEAAETDRAVLAPGPGAVRFAYSDGKAWLDAWREPTRLPRKIRISITPAQGALAPTEMIVAPSITRGPR